MKERLMKLKEFCDLQNGYAFKSDDYVENSNTLSCRMSNIRPDATFDIFYNPKYLPDSYATKYKDFLLQDGDVIVAMTDMATDPKILGVPTIVKTRGFNLLLNQRVGKICKINSTVINLEYLKRVLSRPELKSYYKKFSGGGLQLNISKDSILNIAIPVPTIEEQVRIANILRNAEALIGQRKESLRLLDEFLKSTFFEMFGDPNKAKGKEYAINDLKSGGNETFSNGPFGSDLLTSELTNQGIPVVYIRDIRNGIFSWKSEVYVTKEKAFSLPNCQVEADDILIAKVGDPPGMSAVYPKGSGLAIITQDVIRIRVNQEIILPKYFSFFLNSNEGQRLINKISVVGTRNRFPLGDFKKLKILVPEIKVQVQFEGCVEKIEALKAQYQTSLRELENLYASLSQRAFKGN